MKSPQEVLPPTSNINVIGASLYTFAEQAANKRISISPDQLGSGIRRIPHDFIKDARGDEFSENINRVGRAMQENPLLRAINRKRPLHSSPENLFNPVPHAEALRKIYAYGEQARTLLIDLKKPGNFLEWDILLPLGDQIRTTDAQVIGTAQIEDFRYPHTPTKFTVAIRADVLPQQEQRLLQEPGIILTDMVNPEDNIQTKMLITQIIIAQQNLSLPDTATGVTLEKNANPNRALQVFRTLFDVHKVSPGRRFAEKFGAVQENAKGQTDGFKQLRGLPYLEENENNPRPVTRRLPLQ